MSKANRLKMYNKCKTGYGVMPACLEKEFGKPIPTKPKKEKGK